MAHDGAPGGLIEGGSYRSRRGAAARGVDDAPGPGPTDRAARNNYRTGVRAGCAQATDHRQPSRSQFSQMVVPVPAGDCELVVIAVVHSYNRLASGIAMGLFATGVAASVLLIAAHDRPFTGQISIGPEPLLQIMPGQSTNR